MKRWSWGAGLLALFAAFSHPVAAADRPVVVVTFSILADLVKRIGGDRVDVTALVGPGGDTHAFEPGPKESAELGRADLLVANGLGFEPWLQRLTDASGFKGTRIVATDGVAPLTAAAEGGALDPHAFQDLANAEIYAANIAKGLSAVAPSHAGEFKSNADLLIAEMEVLHQDLKAEFALLPRERRRVLTSHDAFQYFGMAYGIDFVAVQGVSTEAEPTAGDLAEIIRQARDGSLSAIFLENMADPRLAETVAQESGVRIGGDLYADALSDADGPAPDYLTLVRYNAQQLLAAMQ